MSRRSSGRGPPISSISRRRPSITMVGSWWWWRTLWVSIRLSRRRSTSGTTLGVGAWNSFNAWRRRRRRRLFLLGWQVLGRVLGKGASHHERILGIREFVEVKLVEITSISAMQKVHRSRGRNSHWWLLRCGKGIGLPNLCAHMGRRLWREGERNQRKEKEE